MNQTQTKYDHWRMASWQRVPHTLADELRTYVERGAEPRPFLHAVLIGDKTEAFFICDDESLCDRIDDIGIFLSSWAPAECWGSLRLVAEWIDRAGLYGAEQ